MRHYNNGYQNEPRSITAKFDSKCAETGKPIKKGDSCIYYPASKEVFHVDSRQATEFRNMKQDDILRNGCY